jgi:hypothetical protein
VRGQRPAPRRSPVLRVVLALAGVLLVLLVGISLGRALEEGPDPGGSGCGSSVRTLVCVPPAARTVTVTVTTSG